MLHESMLQAALHEAVTQDKNRKLQLINFQVTMVLQNVYMQKVQTQLHVKEVASQKKPEWKISEEQRKAWNAAWGQEFTAVIHVYDAECLQAKAEGRKKRWLKPKPQGIEKPIPHQTQTMGDSDSDEEGSGKDEDDEME
ncbi:hypothetical protein WOLCODRAFT_158398 [Wolfiporia cocos MD-104 SS10]|uniref:Uncharacterized protein n=1 Tax=Wolfiporia cocos (strain MD-104) TaxID=742152 RepID=A0A2H3JAB5_WOLCO|nr:hypothetical protein WOLCODRAFT_158398 [Wolfiporia cocos MD-104 SS10]